VHTWKNSSMYYMGISAYQLMSAYVLYDVSGFGRFYVLLYLSIYNNTYYIMFYGYDDDDDTTDAHHVLRSRAFSRAKESWHSLSTPWCFIGCARVRIYILYKCVCVCVCRNTRHIYIFRHKPRGGDPFTCFYAQRRGRFRLATRLPFRSLSRDTTARKNTHHDT